MGVRNTSNFVQKCPNTHRCVERCGDALMQVWDRFNYFYQTKMMVNKLRLKHLHTIGHLELQPTSCR